MAVKSAPRNPAPLADLLAGVLDPALRRRAGLSVALVQAWEEVVGPFAAARSRPQKLIWPRKPAAGGRGTAEAATLVIACDGAAALELQHETSEIVARVNAFLGANAVGRIRLVQKAVAPDPAAPRPAPRALDAAEHNSIAALTSGIEDAGLRASLQRLGTTVKGMKPRTVKSP